MRELAEPGVAVAQIPGETSSLKLPLESFQAMKRDGLLYEKAVALRPGRYLVKLVARDPSSGLLGVARSAWTFPTGTPGR